MQSDGAGVLALGYGDPLTTLGRVCLQALYLLLSLATLAGSLALLAYTLAADLSGPALAATLCWEGAVLVVGLHLAVQNLRAPLAGRLGGLTLGLGDEVDHLPPTYLRSLVGQADRAFEARARELEASVLSPVGPLRGPRELALALAIASASALAGTLEHASGWSIGLWSLLAFFSPHLLSVLYRFFCQELERYFLRAACVRQSLGPRGRAGETPKATPLVATPASLAWSAWLRFTLQMPLVAAIVALLLGRGLFVALGLVLGAAVLPFLDVRLASLSLAELWARLCGAGGWAPGYEIGLGALSFLAEWRLPHTVGDLARLSLVAYTLGFVAVPGRARRFGARSLPFVVLSAVTSPVALLCWLAYPFIWLLSLGTFRCHRLTELIREAFAGFWGGLAHLWLVYAAFAFLLVWGERLPRVW